MRAIFKATPFEQVLSSTPWKASQPGNARGKGLSGWGCICQSAWVGDKPPPILRLPLGHLHDHLDAAPDPAGDAPTTLDGTDPAVEPHPGWQVRWELGPRSGSANRRGSTVGLRCIGFVPWRLNSGIISSLAAHFEIMSRTFCRNLRGSTCRANPSDCIGFNSKQLQRA